MPQPLGHGVVLGRRPCRQARHAVVVAGEPGRAGDVVERPALDPTGLGGMKLGGSPSCEPTAGAQGCCHCEGRHWSPTLLVIAEPTRLTTTQTSPETASDIARFDALYDEFATPVFNYCLRLTGSEADAADATQNAFINLARKLPELALRGVSLAPYVFATARNASFDLLRHRRRINEIEVELDDRRIAASDGGLEGPESCALRAVDRSTLSAGLSKLPDRQRRALLLREVAGCSYDEIANDLNINRNAVAQLLHRAKGALRRHVAPIEAAA